MTPRTAAAIGGAVAAMAGGGWLWLAHAPPVMIATNAGAAMVGLALLLLAPAPGVRTVGRVAMAGVAAVLLTLVIGVPIDGVQRWLAIGPIRVQPALIAAPIAVVLLARDDGWRGAVAVVAIAGLVALQPDRAVAAGLAVGAVVVMLGRRGRHDGMAAGAAGLGFAVTLLRSDPLAPVRFVEGVLAHGWAAGGPQAVVLALGSAAMIAPALARSERMTGVALAALWLTLLAMSGIGAYPTPMLGYGVSGVLGWFVGAAVLPPAGTTPRRSER